MAWMFGNVLVKYLGVFALSNLIRAIRGLRVITSMCSYSLLCLQTFIFLFSWAGDNSPSGVQEGSSDFMILAAGEGTSKWR